MSDGFTKKQLEQLDGLFDRKLAPIEKRLDLLEQRIFSLEQRMDSLENKFSDFQMEFIKGMNILHDKVDRNQKAILDNRDAISINTRILREINNRLLDNYTDIRQNRKLITELEAKSA